MPPATLPCTARLNSAASLQFVLAVSYDDVTRIESGSDHRRISLSQRDRDLLVLHRLIGVHGINKRALRTSQNRCRRDHCTVLPRLQQQIRVHKLVRPELTIRVVENRLEL